MTDFNFLQMLKNKAKNKTRQIFKKMYPDDVCVVFSFLLPHLSQAELEVVEKEYDNKQEEMRMLQEHFSLMEVRSNEIQEERRLAEETRKEELWLLELKNNAAVVIQAWWRGYSIHRALKNKGKNMKEKKKSSSKAKSKKKK